MKTKQTRKLKAQFGHLAPELSAEQIATALEAEGFILRLDDGRRYAETKVMRGIQRDLFQETVQDILISYQTYLKRGQNG